MYYESELAFFAGTLKRSNLHHHIIDPERPLSLEMADAISEFFTIRDASETFTGLFPDLESATVYRTRDLYLCRYCFFLLPEGKIILIGPYLDADLSEERILEHAEHVGLSPQKAKNLLLYYAGVPVVRQERFLFAMIETFADVLWPGEEVRFRDIDSLSEPLAPRLSEDREDGNYRIRQMEQRYQYENELLEAVSKGDVQKAEAMMADFPSQGFETRVADPVRNMKNYCIVMNTLMRKGVEAGGVHPYDLDRVSSDFAKQIEALHDLTSVQGLMKEMLRSYCSLARDRAVLPYPAPLQIPLLMIEHDLSEDLSLEKLAAAAGVSPGYLSTLFRKHLGKPLTSFINEKRIRHAKFLLKTTNLQIQTIAQHCGILDLHYFCRLFRKFTGKSPGEYRESHRFPLP